MAKTQDRSYQEQYKLNVRMFDIRLRYEKKTGKWQFAHGAMLFKYDNIEEVFEWFNNQSEKVYIRMILEYNRPVKDIDDICEKYIEYCKELKQKYSNLIFFEYRRKYDWKELFSYENMPYPKIYQAVSSMTLSIYDDFCPYLYASTHNKDIIKQGTDSDWLMMDFIGCFEN